MEPQRHSVYQRFQNFRSTAVLMFTELRDTFWQIEFDISPCRAAISDYYYKHFFIFSHMCFDRVVIIWCIYSKRLQGLPYDVVVLSLHSWSRVHPHRSYQFGF